jgi:hypothetical protein
VIVLDCCASGMFKGGDIGAPLAGPGRYIVSSTRGSALANDAAVPTGTSLFTEYLVTGLLGEAKDSNHDGYVDLREIYDYVRTRLAATTKQVPHCRFDGDAEVTLARRRVAGETPVLGKVPSEPLRAGPVFALSENVITLRDVDPDERLHDEVVEIYPLSDAELECTVETSGNWLMAELRGNRVVIHLRPVEGPNRSKIMIRDRRSGTVQALRVEAYVRRRAAFSPPRAAETQTKGSAAPPPRYPPGPPVTEPRPADRATTVPTQSPTPPSRGTARIPPSAAPGGPPTPAWKPGPSRTGNRQAVAAFVIALGALLTALWIVGAALAVVALTVARQAQQTNRSTGSSDGAGLITAARVLSGIAIAIAVTILIVVVFNS